MPHSADQNKSRQMIDVKIVYISDSYFQKYLPIDPRNIMTNHQKDADGKQHMRPYIVVGHDAKNPAILQCVPMTTQIQNCEKWIAQERQKAQLRGESISPKETFGIFFAHFTRGKGAMAQTSKSAVKVKNMIPVASSYIKNATLWSMPKDRYERLVQSSKVALSIYWKNQQIGLSYGWRGVCTQYRQLRSMLEQELVQNVQKRLHPTSAPRPHERVERPVLSTIKESALAEQIKIVREEQSIPPDRLPLPLPESYEPQPERNEPENLRETLAACKTEIAAARSDAQGTHTSDITEHTTGSITVGDAPNGGDR